MKPTGETYRQQIEQAAMDGKPRLFTVFGTLKHYPDEPIIGWGMQLPGEGGVVFQYLGDSAIHSSDTPERFLRIQRVIGDVDLKWLE